MSIFDANNYRKFLKFRFTAMPKQGHGQSKKLAAHLGVSTTLISQILSEEKHFTLDQAFLTTEFLAMNELEAKYFIGLVQLERASSLSYRRKLEDDLKVLKEQSQNLENRLTHQQILNEEQKAIFYSDWAYSAIRMLTSIEGCDSLESISQYFGLPKKMVNDVLQFLELTKLIIKEKNNYKIGPLSTHVAADSPWVKLHHSNWRNKAIELMSYPEPKKLHYTSPMTLSPTDAEKIRAQLVQLIDGVGKIVDDSPAKQLMCLNIDWFSIPSK